MEAIQSNQVVYSAPIFLGLIGTLTTLLVTYWWQQSQRFVQMGNKIPGLPGYPFIGSAHLVLWKTHNQILEMAMEISKKYGNVAKVWLGSKLLIFLTNPQDVEIILGSQYHLEKSEEYRFFKPWFGNGLLISSGQLWRRHRKMIAPTFHQNVLKSFIGTFYENSLNVVKRLEKELTSNEFDCHDYMSETTVDILLETAMGTKRSAQNNQGLDYALAVMKMCDIIHKRTYNIFYRWDKFYNLTSLRNYETKLLNIIQGLTKRVIQIKNENYDKMYKDGAVPSPTLQEIIEHDLVGNNGIKRTTINNQNYQGLRDDLDDIDENDVGEKRRLAFLDLMVETAKSGANLTDDEIKDEVNTIMFEGHDTTAAGSSFVLCLLGIHHDIQDRVYKEIFDIFGDSDRPCTFNDTLELKYLERVILETLRLYPPVPIIARQINEDVKLASENVIMPKGSTVVIGTFKIHRRADIFPNPEKFDPDNFLPERTQNRHYYSFIPFSAGPRSCVGRKYAMLKLKVLLSTILRNYKINSNVQESEYKLQADIILKRTDGFRISIEPRKRFIV